MKKRRKFDECWWWREATFGHRWNENRDVYYVIRTNKTHLIKRRLHQRKPWAIISCRHNFFWNLENETLIHSRMRISLKRTFIEQRWISTLEIRRYLYKRNRIKKNISQFRYCVANLFDESNWYINTSYERLFSKLSRVKNNFRSTAQSTSEYTLSILSLKYDINK